MLLTLLGIITLVALLLENASVPIAFTLLGIVTVVSVPLYLTNTPLPLIEKSLVAAFAAVTANVLKRIVNVKMNAVNLPVLFMRSIL